MAAGASAAGEEAPVARQGRRRLTKSARQDFLSHLAQTAHVAMSAEAAEVGLRAIYKLRQRDPAFAGEWRVALLVGYERIEAALMRKALGLKQHSPIAASGSGELECGEIDVSVAIMLLDRHRATVARAAKDVGDAAFRASRDGAEAMLLDKLQAHARRRATRLRVAEATPEVADASGVLRKVADA
jgi:hypothetical protein